MNKTIILTIGAVVLAIIAIIIYMNFFAKKNEITSVKTYSPNGSFSFQYPSNYSEGKDIYGSIVISSPVDYGQIVMDSVFRKEQITITENEKNSKFLHFSDIRYDEPVEFTEDYFKNIGWKVNVLNIDGNQAFKLSRNNFGNIYVIFKVPFVGSTYIKIDDLLMGTDMTDTPGLEMIINSFKLNVPMPVDFFPIDLNSQSN